MLLLAPGVILLAALLCYPLVRLLTLSFTSGEGGLLSNYTWFFGESVNVSVLRRTLITSLIVTVTCAIVAFPYAYLMTRVGPRWRAILIILVLIPFWTSLMVRNFAWLVLLQSGGPISDALGLLGFEDVELARSTTGVVIAMSQILLPFMVLPLYATLRTIDMRLMSAARGLGAGPFAAFRQVYLPLSLPGLSAGALLVFVLAIGFYLTPAIIGSPQQSMLSQLIVLQVSQLLDWGRAGAMAVVLLVAAMLLVVVSALLARRAQRYSTSAERLR